MAQVSEDVAAALSDGRRVSESVEDWLKRQRQETAPHPLEAELEKIQQMLDALDECLPHWSADKLLWQGVTWFCRMRQRRLGQALKELVEHESS